MRLAPVSHASPLLISSSAHILVPHDGTLATSLTVATVSDAAVRSHATIVVLHVAARELPSQPCSFAAQRVLDHCCHDWRE
jgi:hypothetical protein